jgi:hypothetical protein
MELSQALGVMLMSFTDPLSITIGGTTTPLPRTDVQGDKSVYSSGDGLIKITADHSLVKGGDRIRRVLRIDTSKLAPNQFEPTKNVKKTAAVYVVFDTESVGFTNAEYLAVFTGLNTLMTASSNALIVKLLGGES